MAISVPVPGTPIATAAFGIPIVNYLNALGQYGQITRVDYTGSPWNISTTSATLATFPIPNIPYRQLVIGRAWILTSGVAGVSYWSLGVNFTTYGTRWNRWYGVGGCSQGVVNMQTFPANSVGQTCSALASANVAATLTMGGSHDFSCLLVCCIPIPDA